MNTVHIVGCGTIGANLTLSLCKLGVFPKLHIYDHDVVTYSSIAEFPFQEAVMGLPKVEAISLLIDSLKLNNKTSLLCHKVKVTKDITEDGIIIDCRDKKGEPLKSDVKLSIDGPVLIVDSRKEVNTIEDYNEYVLQKDPLYIELGVSIAANFIFRGLYGEGQYKIYDMRSILHSANTIG